MPGLGGLIRMGHDAPLAVFVADRSIASNVARMVITCADDTGARMAWDQPAIRVSAGDDGTAAAAFQGLFRLGKPSGTIEVELKDAEQLTLVRDSVNVGGGSGVQVVDGTVRVALLLGQPGEAVDKFPRQDAAGREFVAVRISDPAEVPVRPEGYNAARVVVTGGSGAGFLDALASAQRDALEVWTRQGGHLVLAGPAANGEVPANLHRWAPGEIAGAAGLADGGELEKLADTNQQIEADGEHPLLMAQLEPTAGAGILASANRLPLLTRSAHGFGRLTWSAIDLTGERLLGWPGQPQIMRQLALDGLVEGAGSTGAAQTARSRQFGYQDLSGQLRLGLENFRSVRLVSFTSVAVLAVLGVLAFSAGDFFLLRHVLRNRTLTWITFPLMAALLGGAAWQMAGWSRPGEPRFNSLDLLDVDVASGAVRATAWYSVYQPHAVRVRMDAAFDGQWRVQNGHSSVTWQGQPGTGLGAMGSPAGLNLQQAGGQSVMEDRGTGLRECGFAPSSVRNFLIESSGQLEPQPGIMLRFREEGGNLEGTITNTLPCRISGCRLLHAGFAYLLPRPLEPGESISLAETTLRTARVELTRRRNVEGEDRKDLTSTPRWIISDSSLPLIASMLMFHGLAGGTAYTTLTHEFHDRLEMSDLVQLNRAVLTGQVDAPPTAVSLDGSRLDAAAADQQVVVVRLVLPVIVESRAKNSTAPNQ